MKEQIVEIKSVERVNKIWILFLALAVGCMSVFSIDEYSKSIDGMLNVEPAKENAPTPKVTAVYGVSSDDFLPSQNERPMYQGKQVRKSRSHSSFDLPDAFYYIGGPVLILVFLCLLATILDELEQRRRDEMRLAAASEQMNKNKLPFEH